MANHTETDTYPSGVYRWETTDAILGGIGGIANTPVGQLVNRTNYLYQRFLESNTRRTSTLRNAILTGKRTSGLESLLTGVGTSTLTLNANSTDPCVFTVSNGYTADATTGDVGEIQYTKRLTSNLTKSVVSGGDPYMVFLEYRPGNGTSVLLTAAAANVIISSDVPSVITGGLYYDPIVGIWYKERGGVWEVACVLLIGSYETVAGNITAITTYPYRSEFYNEGIDAGEVITDAGTGLLTMTNVRWGGWLLCNGQQVSQARYARLYQRVGTTYNTGGESVGFFRLPNLCGEFIRGADNGRGVDSGRALGSFQADGLKAHHHDFTGFGGTTSPQAVVDTGGALLGNLTIPAGTSTAYLSNGTMNDTGGTETRPRNVAMNFFIKF